MKTIRAKINFSFAFLMTIILVGIGIYFYSFFSGFYMENLEEQLVEKARIVAESTDISGERREETQKYLTSLGENSSYRFTLINRDGWVLGESEKSPEEMDNHLDREEIGVALEKGQGLHIRYSDTLNENLLYAAVPVYSEENELLGFSRAAYPLTEIQKARNNLALIIASVTLLAVILTCLMGTILARNITRPLETLILRTKKASRGDLSGSIPVTTSDEVGELAIRFQDMQRNLGQIMERLEQEKDRFSTLLNAMPEGVIEVDNSGRIILLNPAACKFLGFSGTFNQQSLVSLTRDYALNRAMDKVLKEGKETGGEIELDGLNIRYTVTPLTGGGNRSGAVILLQDITDLKRLEEARKEFIVNISHELKTPLTSIRGFVETIDEEISPENPHHEFLRIIKQETLRVTRLIEDLTVLSRLETGAGIIEKKEEYLRPFLEKVTSLIRKRWEKRGYEILVSPVSDDLQVYMDADKIQQALLNLIDNSCRHNPKGTKIKIKINLIQDRVRFAVIDNGVGIPGEELTRIFERFYRVEKSRYRNYGGTGLGLSIAKHAIKAHDSELMVKSKPGGGTVFFFYLLRG